jgi:hypothetical protein
MGEFAIPQRDRPGDLVSFGTLLVGVALAAMVTRLPDLVTLFKQAGPADGTTSWRRSCVHDHRLRRRR